MRGITMLLGPSLVLLQPFARRFVLSGQVLLIKSLLLFLDLFLSVLFLFGLCPLLLFLAYAILGM